MQSLRLCAWYLTSTPGYILQKETGALKVILIATGSELSVAVEAAKRLGEGVRVVSMPSTYRFDLQDAEYKESVLPNSIRKVGFQNTSLPRNTYSYLLTHINLLINCTALT